MDDDHERCAACGFDGGHDGADDLLASLRALGPRWAALLDEAGPELRARPAPSTWSAIEYAAHSRDVTALHRWAVDEALRGGEPELPAIDGDALVESAAATYADTDPTAVVDDLGRESAAMADAAGAAGVEAWSRGMTIGTDRSTVRRLLEHALHDSVHHLDDVARGIAALRDRPS